MANLSTFMSPYLTDILAQSDMLQKVIAKLATAGFDPSIKKNKYERLVLTGMGSSLHCLYPLHRALCDEDVTSHWIETAELLLGFDSFYAKDTLLIAVSQWVKARRWQSLWSVRWSLVMSSA